MTEPQADAGRALLFEGANEPGGSRDLKRRILAIEAGARQQERERIKKWVIKEGIHHLDSWFVAILDAPAEGER